jgi:hypothetical protein
MKGKMVSKRYGTAWLAAMVVAASGWGVGCGRDRVDVRTYREIRVAPEAAAPRASPHGTMPAGTLPAMAAPSGQVAGRGLAWDTPETWQESPGTGMRMASFAIASAGEEALGTLITLSGPAGGLDANVARWLGQLGLPVPEGAAFAEWLGTQERFETQGGLPGVLVDLVPLTREQGAGEESMMVGVVTLGAQTAFLKLTGPSTLLEQEKDRLKAISRSLRLSP